MFEGEDLPPSVEFPVASSILSKSRCRYRSLIDEGANSFVFDHAKNPASIGTRKPMNGRLYLNATQRLAQSVSTEALVKLGTMC